jgi:hypothetical protein
MRGQRSYGTSTEAANGSGSHCDTSDTPGMPPGQDVGRAGGCQRAYQVENSTRPTVLTPTLTSRSQRTKHRSGGDLSSTDSRRRASPSSVRAGPSARFDPTTLSDISETSVVGFFRKRWHGR